MTKNFVYCIISLFTIWSCCNSDTSNKKEIVKPHKKAIPLKANYNYCTKDPETEKIFKLKGDSCEYKVKAYVILPENGHCATNAGLRIFKKINGKYVAIQDLTEISIDLLYVENIKIEIDDFNFDCYNDIRFGAGVSAQNNIWFDTWLYDSKKQKFVYSKNLSNIYGAVFIHSSGLLNEKVTRDDSTFYNTYKVTGFDSLILNSSDTIIERKPNYN